jgi:hypothetical protein
VACPDPCTYLASLTPGYFLVVPPASGALEYGHFASRRDAEKVARHFSAGIMQQYRMSPVGTTDKEYRIE